MSPTGKDCPQFPLEIDSWLLAASCATMNPSHALAFDSQCRNELATSHQPGRPLAVVPRSGGRSLFFSRLPCVPVLAALIIGFASWPLYKRLVRTCKGPTPLPAASIAMAIVLLVLVVPFAMLLSYGVDEISTWVAWLVEANRQGVPVPQSIKATPFLGTMVRGNLAAISGRASRSWRSRAVLERRAHRKHFALGSRDGTGSV